MNFIKKLLVLLVGLCVPLLLVEGIMRLSGTALPPSIGMNLDRSLTQYRYCPEQLHPWIRGATNVLRLAVIGDSISNGAGIQKDDSFGFRLERMLNMNTGVPPAAVYVFAKGGTSTYMQEPFLNAALKFKPKVIILGICLNDTEDWTKPAEIKQWRDQRLPRVPPRWLAVALKNFRVLNWVYKKTQDVRCNREFLASYERYFDPKYSGWIKFTVALHTFQKRCKAEGVDLVAVIFPELSRVNNYPFDYVHERIQKAVTGEGIYCLDLLKDFRGKNPVRLQAVPNFDGHPDEIAHRIATDAMFEFLIANHLIDQAYLPINRSGGSHTFWSRLADRMKNPAGEIDRQDNVDPSIMIDP